MTTCAVCGDADATHRIEPFGHDPTPACRPCWKAEVNPRTPAVTRRGADWAERNPEAADMEAQRYRMNRQQGRTSAGRRL